MARQPDSKEAEQPGQGRPPDALTLLAFAAIVVMGGSNFIGVRFSNRELPPMFGAALRFAGAGTLLMIVAMFRRLPMPHGKALAGAVGFGLLNFVSGYAFLYWALQEVPAGFGSIVFAGVPLLTLFLAFFHGLEELTWRGVVGGLLAIAGIVFMSRGSMGEGIPLMSVLGLVAAALSAAESAVILKLAPRTHPITTNAVGMLIATPLLAALSLGFGERWKLPERFETWAWLIYLAVIGSAALFYLVVFVIERWTASAASYSVTLFPFVAVSMGALIASEPLTIDLLIGGAVVIAGVYLGALKTRPIRADAARPTRSNPAGR